MSEQEGTRSTVETPTHTGESIDHVQVYEVLSNRRRRCVLYYLQQHPDERVDVGDLSTQIAAWEAGVAAPAVDRDHRKSVHTSLYQHHAPKLADAGVVKYDSGRGKIELTESGASIDLYPRDEDHGQWATVFVGLSTAGGGLTVVCLVGIAPSVFMAVPDATWTGLVSALFLVSSLLYAYDTRKRDPDGAPPEFTQTDGS